MKKLFFTLLAIMALSLNANAAGMCVITGNVEPKVSMDGSSAKSGVNINFTNKNNYMVNVNARITVVSTEGTEQTYTRTYVIAANSEESENFRTGDNKEANASLTVVSMDVQRCD